MGAPAGPSQGGIGRPYVDQGPQGPYLSRTAPAAGWVAVGPRVGGQGGPPITAAPQSMVTSNRYDESGQQYQTWDRQGLDFGPQPRGPVQTAGTALSNPQTTTQGQTTRPQPMRQAISQRIPRLSSSHLTGLAGPRQWGFLQAFHQMWLPPVYPSGGRRSTIGSIAMNSKTGGTGGYGDTYRVPAVYVGQVTNG